MGKELTLAQLAALAAADAKKIDPAVDKRLRQLGQVAVGLMKKSIQEVHAVDTSTMLNSTSAESAGTTAVEIGPTVDYAVYVAYGTSRVAARPFHTMAAKELIKQAREDFNLELSL